MGALYTLYGLWYCQSMRKRSENDLKPRRIRISLQCWGGLNQFVQVMAKEDHTDFVAVYQRMITERVFTFSMYPTAYLLGNKWENTTEYDECSGIIYDEELHSLVNMIYYFIFLFYILGYSERVATSLQSSCSSFRYIQTSSNQIPSKFNRFAS